MTVETEMAINKLTLIGPPPIKHEAAKISNSLIPNNVKKQKKTLIKPVAYSSQGSHTCQLDFCNWLAGGKKKTNKRTENKT